MQVAQHGSKVVSERRKTRVPPRPSLLPEKGRAQENDATSRRAKGCKLKKYVNSRSVRLMKEKFKQVGDKERRTDVFQYTGKYWRRREGTSARRALAGMIRAGGAIARWPLSLLTLRTRSEQSSGVSTRVNAILRGLFNTQHPMCTELKGVRNVTNKAIRCSS